MTRRRVTPLIFKTLTAAPTWTHPDIGDIGHDIGDISHDIGDIGHDIGEIGDIGHDIGDIGDIDIFQEPI